MNQNNTKKVFNKVFFAVSLHRNCYFFVISSIYNIFFPILMCLIISFIPDYGLQCVLGVGRTAYFTITFVQTSMTFALSVQFLYTKHLIPLKVLDKQNVRNIAISNSIVYTFLVSFITIIIYLVASYLYMYYSSYEPNTYIAYYQGMNYIYTSTPYIFLVCLFDILLLYIFSLNRIKPLFFLTFFYGFSYLLIYIFCKYTHLLGIGIGISLTISILITICFLLIYIKYKTQLKINLKIRKFFKFARRIKGLMKEAVIGICINLFRGLGILIVAFSVFNYASSTVVPLSYSLAIVFLLNFMYIIAFLGIGLSDAIKYFFYYYPIDDRSTRLLPFIYMFFINLVVASILCYLCTILIYPLAELYSQNNVYVSPLEAPPLPKDMPDSILKHLPPTVFPVIPNYFYNKNNTLLEDFIYYVNELLNNPQKHHIAYEWIRWAQNNPASLNSWIIANPRAFANWLIQYEFYASCDPHVVNAFINLRSDKQISNPSDVELLIPELKFNAKSMIYLGVFGCTYSSYYIINSAYNFLSKESIPTWIIISGSFALITFVISFGSSFSLLLETWNNNPFKNLDAFTFPIMIVGIILFCITLIHFLTSVFKIKKNIKYLIKNKPIKAIKIIKDRYIN